MFNRKHENIENNNIKKRDEDVQRRLEDVQRRLDSAIQSSMYYSSINIKEINETNENNKLNKTKETYKPNENNILRSIGFNL